MPIFVLASILALIFLLFIPFHISSFNKAQETTLSQIKEGATQAEQQIQNTLNQLNAISQNPQSLDPQINQLNQVIESGKYQGQAISAQNLESISQQRDRLQRLKELAQKPQEFKQEIENIKNQQQTRLVSVKNNYEQEAQKQVLQGGWRIVLNSLMLAIGYSAVSWLGIREEMSASKSGRSKKVK
jgi:ABC-type transporter Mla subunit MlaD